jgi:hypothetical protein
MSAAWVNIEGQIAIPLEEALTAGRLLEAWFNHVATTSHPAMPMFLPINEDERRIIAFGIADLVRRLAELDERVSGLGGISPR